MPYYEYLCDKGHKFEMEQRITEDPYEWCTWHVNAPMEKFYSSLEAHFSYMGKVCNAPCRRQISDTSFTFKGGPPTPKHFQ